MRGNAVHDLVFPTAVQERRCRGASPLPVFQRRAKSRPFGPARTGLATLLLGLFLLSNGCGFFSTREPDSPSGPQTGRDLALSARDVLRLMESSISLRDSDLYLNVIASDFSFTALPSAYPDNPALFDNWGYTQEDNFIRTLLSVSLLPPDSTAQLSFESINEQEWADSSLFQERYTLQVDTRQTDLPSTYIGLMRLVLVRGEDGGWRIRHWEDEAVSGETFTMSQLRAAL